MKAKNITLGGILCAITLLLLFGTSILPTSKLTLFAITSAIIPLAIIRSTIRTALLVYLSSSIIGIIFLPKTTIILYILFFGIYGIAKFYIEKVNKIYVEILIKLIFFNASLSIILLTLKTLLFSYLNIKIPILYVYGIGQILFLVFDYALTLIITYFIKKFGIKD